MNNFLQLNTTTATRKKPQLRQLSCENVTKASGSSLDVLFGGEEAVNFVLRFAECRNFVVVNALEHIEHAFFLRQKIEKILRVRKRNDRVSPSTDNENILRTARKGDVVIILFEQQGNRHVRIIPRRNGAQAVK